MSVFTDKEFYTNKLLNNVIVKKYELLTVYKLAMAECLNNKDGQTLKKITNKFVKEYYNESKPKSKSTSTDMADSEQTPEE